MNRCPTCGQPVARDICIDEDAHNIAVDGRIIHLGLHKAMIMSTLLRNPGRTVQTGFLINTLYGRKEPDDPVRAIRAHISQMRRMLRGTSLAIVNIWGVGYAINQRGGTI